MVKPINCIFVQIDNIYQDEVTFESGVKLFIPVEYERERYVASHATIKGLPHDDYLGLKEGDEVVIAYNVVADYYIKSDTVIYNRCYTFEDGVVWAADWLDKEHGEHMVMAKKVGDGWQPIGNWCMLEEIDEEPIESTLIIPDIAKKKADNKAKWYAGDLPFPKGTLVHFGTGRRQDNPASLKNLYTLPDGKSYIFINKDYILANA